MSYRVKRDNKPKGVSSLIEVQNPNWIAIKCVKLTRFTKPDDLPDRPKLTKRELEEIDRERNLVRYNQEQEAESRADLARLVVIKKQREEAKRKRELEQQLRENEVKEKAARAQKILSKRKKL